MIPFFEDLVRRLELLLLFFPSKNMTSKHNFNRQNLMNSISIKLIPAV